jgi:hypothetical protein
MHLTKLREKISYLVFSRLWGYIFHEKTEFLHRFFELVSLLLILLGPLFFVLKLSDIERRVILVSCLLEARNSLLGVLPILEADKAKTLALARIIMHDRYTCDLTKLFKKSSQVVFCKLSCVFSWKVLDV